MCGIFGYINWNSKEKIELNTLISATNLLVHRGPDGGGYYSIPPVFLAHRRLSIIDLQGGEQPMFSSDGRYGIVFNGEIYNFIELKEELRILGHTFSSQSDTEVILRGYIQWGEGICTKLIGMFSFAIHNLQDNTVFLARDRLGEKPLFYFFKNGVFSFASEIKALTYIAPFSLDINFQALTHYLSLNYVPGTQTLIKDIHKLKPGSWMVVSAEGLKKGSYWEPRVSETSCIASLEEAERHLEELLSESIKLGSRSDVPITLALSGGIDSSLVGYYAAEQGALKEAYCVDFQEKGFSEYPQAKSVADKLGLRLNAVPLSYHILEEFLNVVYHADDPLADSSTLAVWALSQDVSQKYKVMLGGDGGDEIFGGYLTYKATLMYQNIFKYLPSALRGWMQKSANYIPISDGKVSFNYKLMRFLRAFDLPPEEAHFTWNGTWHPREVKKISEQTKEYCFTDHLLSQQNTSSQDILTRLQIIDLENYLPSDILTKVDRMTMAHGVEARAPLLHPDIVKFGLSLPFSYKISRDGQLKYLLRRLVEKKFGESLSKAKKQGFSLPINRWLRDEAKNLLTERLSPEMLKSLPFLNADFVTKAMHMHLAGKRDLGFELWGLMVLVTWYHQKFDKPYYRVIKTTLQDVTTHKQRCFHA